MVQKKSVSEKKQSSEKHFRFWIFLFCGLGFFFAVVYGIWFFLQQPAVGDIRVVKQTLVEEKNTPKKQKQYQGKYLTFSHPDVYAEKSHEISVNGPVKERIFLSAMDFEGSKIAITVEGREGGDFEASPSFQMRVNKPKEYKKDAFVENNFHGFFFIKNTQVFEETAFFFARDFLLSVSVTSPLSGEGLHDELMQIIRSIERKG